MYIYVCIYIYIYIYIYILLQLAKIVRSDSYDTQSAQISQKQDERNIYM